jgi:hypothetical protein
MSRGKDESHFGLEEWADLARGVAQEEKRRAMEAHLASGCKSCAKINNLWRRLHRMGVREAAYAPPDSSVRYARGMFGIQGPKPRRARKIAPLALLFDSFRQAQPPGVRAAFAYSTRQLLYGSGQYHVDIRIELQNDWQDATLVGQVLSERQPENGLGNVEVALLKRGKVKAETLTNHFGEFQLHCDLSSGLTLRLKLPNGIELRLPLVEPAQEDEAAMLHLVDSLGVKRFKTPSKSTRKRD